MDTITDRIITAPIGEFCRLSGLGRTKVYQLLGDGTLDSITIGKRRLVLIDSFRKLIEARRAAASQHRKAALVSAPRQKSAAEAFEA